MSLRVRFDGVLVDLLEPLSTHVAHIGRLFKMSPESVALFTNGKKVDLNAPLIGQRINVTTNFVIQSLGSSEKSTRSGAYDTAESLFNSNSLSRLRLLVVRGSCVVITKPAQCIWNRAICDDDNNECYKSQFATSRIV
jgi:hypothetical protein